jgi:hypothetical protein
MSTFDRSLNTNAIDTLMRYMLCFAPDSLTAALTPLFKSVNNSNDPAINNGFVAADLTFGGLKGDGVAKYLDMGFHPEDITDNGLNKQDGGFALFCPDTYAVATVFDDMGSHNAGAVVGTELSFSLSANNLGWAGGNFGANLVTGSNAGPFTGFILGTTKGAAPAHNTLYKASATVAWVQVVTNANANGGLSPTKCYCFARNQNGVTGGFSSRRFGFAAAFGDVTSAQGQALFNAVLALRQAFNS